MKFDGMQARISLYGKEILAVYGQITRWMLPSRNHVLVTGVNCDGGRTSPFQRLDSLSLGEFMDKMYVQLFILSVVDVLLKSFVFIIKKS